jgi:hypothetical protein
MSKPGDRNFTIAQLFTPEQIEKAATIVRHYDHNCGKTLNELLVERVVKDAMPHIDQVSGQENDPRYMAYLLEYALTVVAKNAPDNKLCRICGEAPRHPAFDHCGRPGCIPF